MCQINTKQNKAGVAILISDEVEFNAKPLIGMCQYIMARRMSLKV